MSQMYALFGVKFPGLKMREWGKNDKIMCARLCYTIHVYLVIYFMYHNQLAIVFIRRR